MKAAYFTSWELIRQVIIVFIAAYCMVTFSGIPWDTFKRPKRVVPMEEWLGSLPNMSADTLNTMGERMKVYAQYDSAIHVYQALAEKSLHSGDDAGYWGAVGELGDCLRNKGEFKAGEAIARRCLLESEKFIDSDSVRYAVAQYYWADYLRIRGKWDKALKALTISLNIQNIRLPDDDILKSKTYHNMGLVYLEKNQLSNSITSLQLSLKFRAKKKSKDVMGIARIYNSIGNYYYRLSNYRLAQKYFIAALRNQIEYFQPSHLSLYFSYINLGRVLRKQRDFSRSLEYFKQGLAIINIQIKTPDLRRSTAYNLMGLVFKDLGQYEKADTLYKAAISEYKKVVGESGPSLGGFFCNLGKSQKLRGDIHNALSSLEFGVKLLEKKYDLKNHYFRTVLFELYEVKTGVDKNRSSLEKCEALFNKTLKDFPNNNNLIWSGYYALINSNVSLLDYTKAIEICRLAIKWSKNKYSPSDTLSYRSEKRGLIERNQILDLYTLFCGVQYKKAMISFVGKKNATNFIFEFKEVINSCDSIFYLIDRIRKVYHLEHSKFWLGMISYNTADLGISSSVILWGQLNDSCYIEKALSYSEKVKYRILYDRIVDLKAMQDFIPKKEQLALKELNQKRDLKLSYLEKFTDKNIENLRTLELREEIILNDLVIESKVKFLENKYKKYYKKKYHFYEPSGEKFKDFSKRYHINIIEYFLGSNFVYCFVVSDQKISLYQINNSDTIQKQINKLRELVIWHSYSDFFKLSNKLFRKLFLNIENEISFKSLLIIPDSDIGYLSFDILARNYPTKDEIFSPPYLLKDYHIHYSFSFTIQEFFFSEKINPNTRIGGYAPGYFNKWSDYTRTRYNSQLKSKINH